MIIPIIFFFQFFKSLRNISTEGKKIIIITRLCSRSANLRQGQNLNHKAIWDWNPDFWINPDLDPDVCRIAVKMLWIYYFVGISHFAECRRNRPVTVWEMNRKSPIPQWRGKSKSDPESVSGTESSPKVKQFLRLVGPITTTSVNEIGWLLLQKSCWQNEWQNERMRDKLTWSHNPPWRRY